MSEFVIGALIGIGGYVMGALVTLAIILWLRGR